MPRAGDIIDALRMAALSLLAVSVLFGPAGLGGSAAFAAVSKTCGVSCPCDDTVHDDHAGEHEDHAGADPCDPCDDGEADAGHEDGEPCEDRCPDDCPNCGCCVGVATAGLPVPATSRAATCTSARMLAPVDAQASGTFTGVFRPPRSQT